MYEGQTVSIWDKSHTPQRSSWQLSQSKTRCGRVWNVFWVPNVTSSVNSGSQVTCRLFLHNQIICLKHQIFILLMNLKFEQNFTGVSCLCSAQHQFGTVQLGTKIATLKMLCLFIFFILAHELSQGYGTAALGPLHTVFQSCLSFPMSSWLSSKNMRLKKTDKTHDVFYDPGLDVTQHHSAMF